MGSSTAYIVPLTPNHSENPIASDSAMGRFVILLLCLAYFSWPQGCMGSGTGVSGGTRGSGLGQLVKEFNEKKSPAPVNGSWGSWSSWSSCDTDCGSGPRYRTRNCNGQKNGGKYCNGSRRESKTCSNSRKCSGSSGSKEWYEERDWSNFGGGFL